MKKIAIQISTESDVTTGGSARARRATTGLSPIARKIRDISLQLWGENRAVDLYGQSEACLRMLDKIEKFARFKEPVLITGESGSGKELVAAACHLLSPRAERPYEAVNCPQYQDGNITVSELFGHVKGSFTGATGDKKGHFETANGGTVFLDEVADLHTNAQTMLLRALAQQEFKPLGSERTVRTNVRVVAATNRPLGDMIHSNEFREDLYFRLRYFPLEIPPLRERGDDWKLLMEVFLDRLGREYDVHRKLSAHSERLLEEYRWPGNVRELKSIAAVGYGMAEGESIEPEHFASQLRKDETGEGLTPLYTRIYSRIVKEQKSFWDEVYLPFMDRELNRTQCMAIIRRGLVQTRGSYRNLLKLFNMPETDYQRFMDFLRHQRLKPEDLNRRD
ncbi:MAG: sigma 54-interacting transcriptional regulator [Verrucomicrobiales bacterium]